MKHNNEQAICKLAETYTAAWCSQNATSGAAFFAGVGSPSVNEAAPSVGREAITAVAQGFLTAFPDLQVLLDDLRLEDDRTIYHWMLIGTNTGPGGIGCAVCISGFEIGQIGADGLIANSRGSFDAEECRRKGYSNSWLIFIVGII